MADPAKRSTEEVLDDHPRCRSAGDIERDLERNYATDVVILSSTRAAEGHDAARWFHAILRNHVPGDFEFPVKHIRGPYAFIEWRAREPGRSDEDGADSFVIENGRIVLQTIHYTLQETMPT